MKDKAFFTQLMKFGIIGISNTIISYITFLSCYYKLFVGDVFYSQFFSYSAGIIWSYTWNRIWTFKKKSNSWKPFTSFFILQLILLSTSTISLDIAKDSLDWNINLIWASVMAVITIINFTFTKYLVFRARIQSR